MTGGARLYYILDTRQQVGNCGLWWGPARAGYVCSLDEAGKYEEDDALSIQRSRGTDVAMSCEEVDALAVRHVRIDTNAFYAARNKAKRRRTKPATPGGPLMATQVEHRRWARGVVAGYAKDGVRADREVQVCVSADGLAVDFYCSAAEARDYAAALIAVADACDEARAKAKEVP